MKETINRLELEILDSLALTSDGLAQALSTAVESLRASDIRDEIVAGIRPAQTKLADAFEQLLLVEGWDEMKRAEIARYIKGGGPTSIEYFVASLGIAVVDPLVGDAEEPQRHEGHEG